MRRRSGGRRGTGLMLAAGVLLAAGCSSSNRLPNELERNYSFLALDTGRTELCEKISPRAVTNSVWKGPPRFERSVCYLHAALRSQNAGLCAKVEPVPTWFRSADYYAPANCRKLLLQGAGFHYAFDRRPLLRALGYTSEEVDRWVAREGTEFETSTSDDAAWADAAEQDRWRQFYQGYFLEHAEEWGSRVGALPDFSNQ